MADASHSPTVESQRVTGSQSPCTRELRLFVTLTAHMPTAPRRLSFYRHGSFLLWFQPPVVPTISRTQDHPSGSGTNDRPARGRLIRLFRDVLKTRNARRQGFLSYVNYKSWDCRGARTTAYYTMESSMESSILCPNDKAASTPGKPFPFDYRAPVVGHPRHCSTTVVLKHYPCVPLIQCAHQEVRA